MIFCGMMVTSGPWERRKAHHLPNPGSWEGYFRVGQAWLWKESQSRHKLTLWKGDAYRCEATSKDTSVYHRVMGRDSSVEVTAFVLAGGKSTRMGSDKAFLEFEGRTLLERALELAQSITTQVRIIGSYEKFERFGPAVEDIFRECGPLGGIHAGLRSSQTDLNLMLAVDMPFVAGAFLQYLLREAVRAPDVLAIVPRAEKRWQTLCAVYRRGFADVAEKGLRAGKNRIDLLFESVSMRAIEEEELQRAGFSAAIFGNVNTPADLESAKLRAHEEVHP